MEKPKVAALETELRCYTCGKSGHTAKNYFAKPNPVAAVMRGKEEQIRKLQDEFKELSVRCHELEYDEPLEAEETEVKAAACQPAKPRSTARTKLPPPVCSKHRQVRCSKCISLHHCQALICQECGLHHPVVADACRLQNKVQKMPVADGTIEGKPVSVLRDTGYSTVVVRQSLVPDGKLTDQKENCILIDGTVRYVSVARILVKTLYFRGIMMAVCMEDPICDPIIGNIQGAVDSQTSQQETQAVQIIDKF